MQAELFLMNCAAATTDNETLKPNPDLTAETVAQIVVRSLQLVDYPHPLAGLERCFDFFTFDCRKAVTGRQGGTSVERFCEYGLLAPALQPFMGAQSVDLDTAAATYTPAQPPHRGALASLGVTLTGSSLLRLQHASGLPRWGGVTAEAPRRHMVLRLEQQRRPPLRDCWLVREVLDVRYAFAGDMGNEIPE